MTEPRDLALEREADPTLPDGDQERLRGYAVTGLPFSSGHILAMRRFPASSIGPAYTSVWHRTPDGRFTIYQDQEPQFGCPRAYGPETDEVRLVPISVDWTGPRRFTMAIDADGTRLDWAVVLTDSRVTRALNSNSAALPRSVRLHPAFMALSSRMAGPLLRTGRVRLGGIVPSGQRFAADLHSVWLIDDSTAVLDGVDLGRPVRRRDQPRMRDFWFPRRGVFAVVDAFFEPYDPDRHLQVASRVELS